MYGILNSQPHHELVTARHFDRLAVHDSCGDLCRDVLRPNIHAVDELCDVSFVGERPRMYGIQELASSLASGGFQLPDTFIGKFVKCHTMLHLNLQGNYTHIAEGLQ